MGILRGENSQARSAVDNLSTLYRENYFGGPLRVDAQSIGVSFWHSMIDQTQKDTIERGFIVSIHKGNYHTSKIHKGSGAEAVFDGVEMRTRGGSYSPPLLPHGLSSLNPSIVNITAVHSHALPNSLAHLPTTIISDADIQSFIPSKYHALCAVDRGGVHLLVRTRKQLFEIMPDRNMIKNSIAEIAREDGGIKDVIIKAAKYLQQFGLAYLYTSQLEADKDGTITFQEPTK